MGNRQQELQASVEMILELARRNVAPSLAGDVEYGAPLVQAAPDLLDLLRQIARSACLEQMNGDRCFCFSCSAKAVIAKTEGTTDSPPPADY